MPEGRFTREKLQSVLAEICVNLGLDASDARLIRLTNNAVYALESESVVVRIIASRGLRHRGRKVVEVAKYLAEHDVPAVRLLPGISQPLRVGEHLATLWEYVPSSGREPTTADLAELLRSVHSLPPPSWLIKWAPLDDVRARLADAEIIEPADHEFLLERLAEVESALANLEFVLPESLVHGDAYVGNVIMGPDGPVLCDFDSSCGGPAEWDLTPVAVGRERFGDPPENQRLFARTYGFDLTEWSGYPVLRSIRELKLTTSVLPSLRGNPEVRPELRRRLDDLRAGRTPTQWSRYR
jgi:aminoglycoside phosphotransferase (APT) family kinase protein